MRHLRRARHLLLLTITLGLLTTATVIAQMALLSHIVSLVFLGHAPLAILWPPLLLLLGASMLRAIGTGSRQLAAAHTATRVKLALRAELFAHLLRLGPAYIRVERTGELVTTAMDGVERLDGYVSGYLPQRALSVLIPIEIAAAIAPLDFTSAMLLMLTGPVIPLLMMLVGSYAQQRIQRQWGALTRMSAYFLDTLHGLPTLLLFGRAEAESERVERISQRFRERTLAAVRVAFLSGVVLEFMTAAAIGVVAVTLGVRLVNGGISFEHALLILLLTPEFYRPLHELGAQRHTGMEGKAALASIADILETPASYSMSRPSALHPTSGSLSGAGRPLAVTLRDVSYTYPDSDRPALDHVTLTLAPGTRTALVGRSGAGKSTLVNLLMRFQDAQSGAIAVSGLPLEDLPSEMWRKRVALVPQHPYLFAGSVWENLRLAWPGVSDEEVRRAARLAGADDFIMRLPQRYDTPLGERGARLSAGQAQRLAIARAFLKDAPLLILDEPTSCLDPESEAAIRDALRLLMRERTVLVVAHRLNTALAADRIVVLEQGRVVERGSHRALLRRGGVYARMAGAVAAGGSAGDAGRVEVPA